MRLREWMREEIEADTPLASALHLPGIVRIWDLGVDMICRNAPALAVAWGPKKGNHAQGGRGPSP